ncbi:MAG TPA: DUF4863 family protein [Planctomycetota bacterium]
MTDTALRLDPVGLRELLEFAAGLDLADSGFARAALEAEFPFQGEFVRAIDAAMRADIEAGKLCDRGEDPVRYSRVFKATGESMQFSADAVLMSAPGPRHTHPKGEIDLCFAASGEPDFDGNPPGWTVYAPGSTHAPTVRGGSMHILYLLPGGAIEFHAA